MVAVFYFCLFACFLTLWETSILDSVEIGSICVPTNRFSFLHILDNTCFRDMKWYICSDFCFSDGKNCHNEHVFLFQFCICMSSMEKCFYSISAFSSSSRVVLLLLCMLNFMSSLSWTKCLVKWIICKYFSYSLECLFKLIYLFCLGVHTEQCSGVILHSVYGITSSGVLGN